MKLSIEDNESIHLNKTSYNFLYYFQHLSYSFILLVFVFLDLKYASQE